MDGKDSIAEEPQQQSQQPQQPQQPPVAATRAAGPAPAAAAGRRGTMAGAGHAMMGAGGPRRSIAGGMLGRAALMTLGNLAANSRRSKAQEVRLENTYRMAPKPEERLKCWKLRPLMTDALSDVLAGYQYSPATAGRKACDAALAIRNRARDAGYERYKFVACVTLVESRPPGTTGLAVASRALWASGGECGDNYTEAEWSAGKSVRAHATLYAVYFE